MPGPRRRRTCILPIVFICIVVASCRYYVSTLPRSIGVALEQEDLETAASLADRWVWLSFSAESHRQRSRVASRLGELEFAQQELRVAAQKGLPRELYDLDDYLLRGTFGDFDAVEPGLRAVFQQKLSSDPEVCAVLARGYRQRFQMQRVLACCERWRELAPRDVRVHLLLGEVHAALGSPSDKIAEHYRRALEVAPHHGEALRQLIVTYVDGGRFAEAQGLLNRLGQVKEHDPELLWAAGACARHHTEYEKAKVSLEKCLKVASNHLSAMKELSQVESELGNVKRAEELLRSAIEVDANDTQSWYLLASTLLRQGDREHAAEAMEKFKTLRELSERFAESRATLFEDANNQSAMEGLIRGFLYLNQPDSARQWSRRLLQIDPQNRLAKEVLTPQ